MSVTLPIVDTLFSDEFAELAITFADVDKFFLKFADLFATKCYIVDAEFGQNPTDIVCRSYANVYTLVYFSPE